MKIDGGMSLEEIYLRQYSAEGLKRSRNQSVVEIPFLVGWRMAVIAIDCRNIVPSTLLRLMMVLRARLPDNTTHVNTSEDGYWLVVQLYSDKYILGWAVETTAKAIRLIQEYLEKQGLFGHAHWRIEGVEFAHAFPKIPAIPGSLSFEDEKVDAETARVA